MRIIATNIDKPAELFLHAGYGSATDAFLPVMLLLAVVLVLGVYFSEENQNYLKRKREKQQKKDNGDGSIE